MERENLQKVVSTLPLLDNQAWALCFKSAKFIDTVYGSLINNDSCESVLRNMTLDLGSVELLEDGEVILDLKLGKKPAADENHEAAVKAESTSTTLMGCSESLFSPTPDPPRFRSKFDRLRYEAYIAKKKQEDARQMEISALVSAYLKELAASKSASNTATGSARGATSAVNNTGTGDLPSPPRFRSIFDRLRHEAQAKPDEEQEPQIGTVEGEIVLALGRLVHQTMKSTRVGDKDPKLYELIARMTGDLAKRPGLKRVVKACEIHAKWNGEECYTITLSQVVGYYQIGGKEKLFQTLPDLPPMICKPYKRFDESSTSDESSVDYGDMSDEPESEDLPTPPPELLYDTDEKRGSTPSDLQDTNQNDTTMTNSLGARDAEEKSIPSEPVGIKSEKDQDDVNGTLPEEEPSKEKGNDLCEEDAPKMQNSTIADTVQQMKAKMVVDQDQSNAPQRNWTRITSTKKADNIKLDEGLVGSGANVKKGIGTHQDRKETDAEPTVQGSSPRIAVNSEPSKEKGDDRRDEDTPKMQDTTIAADTESSNMAAKPTGNEDELKKVNQEKQEQGDCATDCELNTTSPEDCCAQLTVQQMKKKMGIDQDKGDVPKRNWTKTTCKGKTENTKIEPAKPLPVESIAQAKAKPEAGPTDGIPPISVNWEAVPRQWSATMTVQEVVAKIDIEDAKMIVQQKKETTMGASSEDVYESDMYGERSAPTTIECGNVAEESDANLTVQQLKVKMGIDESNPPMTVMWGNEPEQWAAQLNVAQLKKQMGIKEKKVTSPRKNRDREEEVEIETTKPKMSPRASKLSGERLSKTQIEQIKAQLLGRGSVPQFASRKTKKAVKKTAPNQPKDAGFLKSMLHKAGTYLNPFQWTKAAAEPVIDSSLTKAAAESVIDSSLNAEAVESDLTSKKGWLPAGVGKILHGAADVSVLAALGYCGYYNVLSAVQMLDLVLMYIQVTSKPTVAGAVFNLVASQAVGFLLSPEFHGYLYPKTSYRLHLFGIIYDI